MQLEFQPWPKIGRLSANATVTEKIDGTNAQILFDEHGNLLVGSRKREIHPEGTIFDRVSGDVIKGTDNFGFAGWVHENRAALFEFLGEGRHYGEWAGSGIQRGYGLDHKRFFLFNTARFGAGKQEVTSELYHQGLDVVPVLYEGPNGADVDAEVMVNLRNQGSQINNFSNPEGIIVYLHGIKHYHKMTFEHTKGKWNP